MCLDMSSGKSLSELLLVLTLSLGISSHEELGVLAEVDELLLSDSSVDAELLGLWPELDAPSPTRKGIISLTIIKTIGLLPSTWFSLVLFGLGIKDSKVACLR